ncbi:MAG: PSD1 and planctomycete cytochrome C domain-containing protein [Chthoniobacteraceae bacterium]
MSSPRLTSFALAALTCAAAAIDAPDFNREVRPILSRYCFKCHGPDDKARKGGLRLDLRDSATREAKSGAIAIIPGKTDESELHIRIFSTDKDDTMPPPETKTELSAAQKDILKRWIAAGASYDPHWAFVAPRKGTLNSIDAFIDARLSAAGLKRSPEADRATLIRRVSYDLIGLPPTPDEITAFETDAAPDAYERLVDRLLASPQYGERWARRWLDLARYADTNGYEKDRERSIWPYRDWVVRALNADMPFDRFTIEQIAGDLLPGATLDQKIATGFHRNTMLNEEGGIDPLEFRYHAMTDRVATTGATWLGLTLGCAQCHTHKFDPIPHREYFGIFALLNNADEPELDLPPADAAQQQRDREARARKLIAELPFDEQAYAAWLAKERAAAVEWTPLKPAAMKTNLPLLTVQPDLSIFGSGDTAKVDTYELRFAGAPAKITAIRLEALPDERLPAHGPGLCYYEGPKGDFFLGEFQVTADGQRVKFARATESYANNNFGKKKDTPVSAEAATDGDPQTGWSCADRPGEAHEAVFVPAQPITAAQLDVKMLFGRHYTCPLGRFRISVTTDPRGAEARENLSEDPRERFLLATNPDAAKEVRALRQPPKYQSTLVMRERPPENPRPTFLHNRGEYLQPTERVEPAVLSILHPLPDGPRDRLALARWLVARENPLTARVTVNRAWAAFFGRGIVNTTDDFGYQGEPPTHPELLDWLAIGFMESGWSRKKLHRLIVTSATYRQSSQWNANDPQNTLLSRFPRTRLDAELIRDGTLRAAGLLSQKMGGAPVKPPQPEGVSEVAYGSPKWQPSAGEDRHRRSLYTFIKRTAPFALYNTFDAPTGEACIPRRDISNTPLQALTLLNDIVFIEAAQSLGKALVFTPGDDDAKLTLAYRRVLSRNPRPDELPALREFVKTQRARFTSGELDAKTFAGADAETAAWTALARALFNLDEAITKS